MPFAQQIKSAYAHLLLALCAHTPHPGGVAEAEAEERGRGSSSKYTYAVCKL